MSEKEKCKVHASEFKTKINLEALKNGKKINKTGQEYSVNLVQAIKKFFN